MSVAKKHTEDSTLGSNAAFNTVERYTFYRNTKGLLGMPESNGVRLK